MVSFRAKFSRGLIERGYTVCADPTESGVAAVLVIGGTRQLGALYQAKKKRIPIVQRLDGMNWVHRVRKTGIRHYLRAESGNLLLSLIRSRFADRIVYQSRFSKAWWERVYRPAAVSDVVIYNGVDLDAYSPEGRNNRPEDRFRILLVEGSLLGGYDTGLLAALDLANGLLERDLIKAGKKPELMVVGRVGKQIVKNAEKMSRVPIVWKGLMPRESIPEIDRSAHLLFSGDVNAACPNAVIEALACGLPVVAYDTGALPELVADDAGKIVAYGGDPWKLEAPDSTRLAEAAADVLEAQERYRKGARRSAVARFSLTNMVDAYLRALTVQS